MDNILRSRSLIGMSKDTQSMSNIKLEHISAFPSGIELILKAFKPRSTWRKSGEKKGGAVALCEFY